MNERFEAILKRTPRRRSRSPLEEYRPLVEQLRLKGMSLRAIAAILKTEFGVATSHVAIMTLLRNGAALPNSPTQPEARLSSQLSPSSTPTEEFRFEPEEPLRLAALKR